MRSTATAVIAFTLLLLALYAVAAPPPAMIDLGAIVPTPEPTREVFRKKRLITTITIQNAPDGETLVTFEATDYRDEGDDKFKMLASDQYSLTEETPELAAMREKILTDLREIERALLGYVEEAGPPVEREPFVGTTAP